MLGLTFYKGTTRISHLNHKIQNRQLSFLLPFFSGGGEGPGLGWSSSL